MKNENLLVRFLLATIALVAAMSVANAQQLIVSAGTSLKHTGGSMVLYNTNLQNNGSILCSGSTLVFSGNSNNSISGSGVTKLHALQIAKQNGQGVLLQKNISAAGTVLFNGGILDLGDRQFELLYPGGMLQNESSASRIVATGTGEVFIMQSLNAPASVNPGNLGAAISSDVNLGATVIRRGHKVQMNNANEQGIARYFQIIPANNANVNAILKLYYLDAELNNNTENSLALWQKTTAWSAIGAHAADMNTNYVQKNGINTFSFFTLGKGLSGALPLQLTMFNVSCKNAGNQLRWSTANEVNTKQFVIERSANGVTWTNVAVEPAKGNILQHTYEMMISAGTGNYFRLKMEDADGRFTYSPIRTIDCSKAESIVVGPNPTKGRLLITASITRAESVNIVISDMSGKTLFSQPLQVQQGSNSKTIDLSAFPAGTYLVSIKGSDVKLVQLVVKQ